MSCGSCNGCNTFNKLKNRKIVLVGNPNVGKSVIYNELTGYYAEVSNYPGTTVETPVADTDFGQIVDTPGVYGIGEKNDEELITKNKLSECDLVINVVSALSLERDLFLTLQLIERGFNIILVINQIDEAEIKGINIDFVQLESILGVKVIPTIAIKKVGIERIKCYLSSNCSVASAEKIPYLSGFITDKINRANLTDFIDKIETTEDLKLEIYSKRTEYITQILGKILNNDKNIQSLSEKIGLLLLNPVFGIFFGIFVLYGIYELIGVLVAGKLVDFLQKSIFINHYNPFMVKLVSAHIENLNLREVLVGEFGVLTMTVQYTLGVLLPLVVSFNIFMALLEDSGYLPRLATLTDRFLNKIGLNGRAIIPIILGFGCVTMATLTTRILGSQRERTIASAILGIAVPCSAQLGIIVGLMAAAGGLHAWIVYIVSITTVLIFIGSALNYLLPGTSSHLFIDIPPIRFPMLKNVLTKTISKTQHFLIEATPLFFAGTLMVGLLKVFGGLTLLQKLFTPLTVGLLHLPKQAADVFLMGLIRRDFGAAGLAKLAGIGGYPQLLTPNQILVSLVVITLFVPCIASVVVMYKERGWKEASSIWFGSWILAFAVGSVLTLFIN